MVAVGVDTHKQRHVAVALDRLGQVLGELSVDASPSGYAQLLAWAAGLGEQIVFGIEGAGSYGAGVTAYLLAAGQRVLEVERPRRRERRSGKSDSIDALAAAKRVLADDGVSTPRAGGTRHALAVLLTAYRSVMAERTRVLNQLQALHTSAPVALRERIGEGSGQALTRRLARMRLRADASVQERVCFGVLRDLARRAQTLREQARRYERELAEIVRALDATLLDEPGIGPISAGKLLVSDPARFRNEAAFARCNGTAPLPASSGKTVRHRLSRGGDRQVNNAIHTIALSRSIHHPATRAYLKRKTTEGKTKREAMRALKRHLSRHLYKRLTEAPLTS
jgi:transposase